MEGDFISEHQFNEVISSEIGDFKVKDTPSFNFKEEATIYISLLKRAEVIDAYIKSTTIIPVDKKSSVLGCLLHIL